MDGIFDHLDGTAHASLDRCTSENEACPTAALIGLDKSDAATIAAGLGALTRGAGDPGAAARWVEACNGSGQCTAACPEGINVRQWVSIERMRLRLAREPDARAEAARRRFRTMSHSVRLLSSMWCCRRSSASRGATPRAAGRFRLLYRQRRVHAAPRVQRDGHPRGDRRLLSGDGRARPLLRRLSFPRGRSLTAARRSRATPTMVAKVGAKRVLSWCPSCTKQFGENFHDYAQPAFEFGHIAKFFVEELGRMRPKFRTDLPRQRVAIHEHEGIAGVAESVNTIVAAIPHLEPRRDPFRIAASLCLQVAPLRAIPSREPRAHRRGERRRGLADVLVTTTAACYRAGRRGGQLSLRGEELHRPDGRGAGARRPPRLLQAV